ncbi:MAG: hypothetical protein HKP58_12105, partial [Desulfatitalea sp.]|nr:hypothetical protein [Desulfatitalea sp.]
MAGNWFRSDTWASAARLQKIGLLSLLMAVVLALIDLTLAAVPLVLM